ncbi:YhdT family protein [Phocoenobacter skyensis]|uniref:DUF997 family protein n=1 Tax=Phocoenobacter skyensis TaxID=97481 RepID=A0A1H7XCZ6_9PAST|nr:DUF997 family protein [Pasteurella skyensis]MDP8079644.1 DUF997 family protein [Pasteurella skyensis]MDP8085656.1 DUF997 family protein [Pasteurella skyensis]MDP8185361.1 DUF997 family protein [Pasteurella skyensis]QLB22126.1 hypothetical protein A6B44_02505 [Pasteurella skyensis]SEM31047.1 Uncharacterized membrane protein YhdT [Pasteurella skyensis]
MKFSLKQQLAKETRWALGLTLFYISGWVGFGYFSPTGKGLLGFPIWFEFACIYFPIVFIFTTLIVVKIVYKDVDLEDSHNES